MGWGSCPRTEGTFNTDILHERMARTAKHLIMVPVCFRDVIGNHRSKTGREDAVYFLEGIMRELLATADDAELRRLYAAVRPPRVKEPRIMLTVTLPEGFGTDVLGGRLSVSRIAAMALYAYCEGSLRSDRYTAPGTSEIEPRRGFSAFSATPVLTSNTTSRRPHAWTAPTCWTASILT